MLWDSGVFSLEKKTAPPSPDYPCKSHDHDHQWADLVKPWLPWHSGTRLDVLTYCHWLGQWHVKAASLYILHREQVKVCSVLIVSKLSMLEINNQSLKYADSRVFLISYQITIINLAQIWSFWRFSCPKLSFAPTFNWITLLFSCFLSIQNMWNWDQFQIIYVSNNM